MEAEDVVALGFLENSGSDLTEKKNNNLTTVFSNFFFFQNLLARNSHVTSFYRKNLISLNALNASL